MENSDEIERLRRLYSDRYPPIAKDINYIWHPRNPISIYYRQAQERSIVSMINSLGFALENIRVLDVGCGSGPTLRFFSSIGGDPSLMHGVDLIPERLHAAQVLGARSINYAVCNAQNLPYRDTCFDLSCLFTVFASIFDDDLRKHIAQEISRILKDGGHLLLYDMDYSKSIHTRTISISEIKTLFPNFKLVFRKKIHSVWISRLAKHSYFICETVDQLPFLRKTHNLYLLKKIAG